MKSCFLAKKNNTTVTIFQDKYFDFMYEDDFIKIIKFYIDNWSLDSHLPKTFNLSYTDKYKLSDIASIILDNKEQIVVHDTNCLHNYCGNNDLLNNMQLKLDGLHVSLNKFESQLGFFDGK
jgi:hypothetical protein